MIKGIERNQLRMSKTKEQMSQLKQKDLQDHDKIKLLIFDEANSGIKIMPTDIQTTERSFISPQKEETNEQPAPSGPVEEKRTTAQVEPEEAIQKLAEEQPRNIYHSRPNLEDMKFIIDKIWATVAIRKRGDDFIFSSDNFIRLWALITQNAEDDIEIVLEEPLMRFHSCMGKTYKKKDLIHVTDVLIKNVSVSVIDNVLQNSNEKLYRINKDFVRSSDTLTSEIDEKDF